MHPILFSIPTPWGAVPIYSYGVMLGLSLLVAWYFIMYMGSKVERMDKDLMANCFVVTALTAILFARLFYVFTNLDEFPTILSWFNFRSGGLVAYGGFLGGFFGAWGYLKWRKVPLLPWADLVAPTLGSGLALTRIGCYLYGCDYGKPLSASAPAWLAKLGTFPHWNEAAFPHFAFDQQLYGSPAYVHHVNEGLIAASAATSLPVHPTELYSSLAGVVIFASALWVFKHRRFRGEVFFYVAAAYSVWRFFLEFWRDDPERGAALGFSESQWIAIIILPIVAFAWLHFRRRAKARGDITVPPHAQQPIEASA